MSLLRSVYSGTRRAQDVVKDFSRFRDVAMVLARYGFGAILERTPEFLRLGPLRPDPALQERSLPQRVVGVLAELGPTFVKFGQIMSTRGDILSAEFVEELAHLQDRVPPVAFAEVRAVLEVALGRPLSDVFRSVEEVPLASASIAQVHGAVLLDGTDVVLKIQRPGIRPKIEGDLSLLNWLARQVAEVEPRARMFNLVGMVDEFERSLWRETDFTIEASNMERVSRAFVARPAVRIPALHKVACTDVVLCMDRIHGEKLTSLASVGADAIKRRNDAVAVYLDAAYQMIFVDGFFHGDLHPGNALLQADGRLTLLDFGMVGRLSPELKDRLIDLVFAVLTEDMRSVARVFFTVGVPEGRVDYRAYEGAVVEVMERHFVGRAMSEIQIGLFFRDMAEVAMRHRVRLPSEYTMLFKALVTTEGLAKALAPHMNPVEAARPYIEQAVRNRYSPDAVRSVLLAEAMDLARTMKSFPAVAEHLLADLERGELTVRVDSGDRADAAMARVARSVDRLGLAVLVVGVLMTVALLVPHVKLPLDGALLASLLLLLGLGGAVLLLVSFVRARS